MNPRSVYELDGELVPRAFYSRNTVQVARDLLGKVLVRRTEKQLLAARIVEVEAYRGHEDPASHAYVGLTKRNSVMFGPPGHAYVYFIYGNHHCLNVTSEPEGVPGAVLLRAAEPIGDAQFLQRKFGNLEPSSLMNGPGKLTKAMEITRELNGVDMTMPGALFILDNGFSNIHVVESTRIGVKLGGDKPWRFHIEGSRAVSRH